MNKLLLGQTKVFTFISPRYYLGFGLVWLTFVSCTNPGCYFTIPGVFRPLLSQMCCSVCLCRDWDREFAYFWEKIPNCQTYFSCCMFALAWFRVLFPWSGFGVRFTWGRHSIARNFTLSTGHIFHSLTYSHRVGSTSLSPQNFHHEC